MAWDEFTRVFESPDPKNIYAYSPSVMVYKDRIFVTMDVGGEDITLLDHSMKDSKEQRGRIYVSEDGGKSFSLVDTFGFTHARIFSDGDTLYIIGHYKSEKTELGDLAIICSADGGVTWERETRLTDNEFWHAAANNVIKHNGCIYLAMERDRHRDCRAWAVSVLEPVVLRARSGTDLCDIKSWSFSQTEAFRDFVKQSELDCFGVPFYKTPQKAALEVAPKRACAPTGWLETNIVKLYDESHYWYDENTFHLLMRAHTGGTGYGCIMKVTEKEGEMKTDFQLMPSGVRAVFMPMPGGHMKFHILYDDVSELYWLLSSQAVDSMTKCEYLPKDRYNLPNNERHRLQLHFSKNLVDWCFACMVSVGKTQKESRHYASMDIDGDDLVVASRSGDEKSECAHNCNLITFHRITDFRKLIY